MFEDTITLIKKLKRVAMNLCVNCGKNPCMCRIPKWVARRSNDRAGLPVGMTRRGGQKDV